ncbi:MAG: hypothetical protein HOH66_05190 [Rhodospirillaceae bacterium]|nr:hypothetical protein [Rhodospirillaceae bacterium]
MNLLEHQGKTLFRRYGLAVPVGVLWPQPLPISAGGYVAKAQIRAGGRGKAGGIRFAENGETAGSAAAALAKAEIGGRRVEAVLVEERLAIAREFYVAVAIDRDRRCRSFVLAAQGGVEIESLPADRVRRVPVDPLIGLRPHHLRRAVAALEPADKAVAGALSAALEALYRLAQGEDADLVEVNPLTLTADGRIVAADAKVTLDPRAAYRHGAREGFAAADGPAEGEEIERIVAAAGGTAVPMRADGNTVAVVSGAGLTMATADMLTELGVPLRCVMDLGGAPVSGAEGMVPVFEAVAALAPEVTFINAYLHSSLADKFAEAIRAAYGRRPFPGRVVLRLLGRNAEAGHAILAPLGFEVVEGFVDALETVARSARAAGAREAD